MHILTKQQRKEATDKGLAEKDDIEASRAESKYLNSQRRSDRMYETSW